MPREEPKGGLATIRRYALQRITAIILSTGLCELRWETGSWCRFHGILVGIIRGSPGRRGADHGP